MPSWFPPIDGQEERELGAGAHRELAVDAGEMGLDCLRAHAELLCSLPVRPAGADQRCDSAFGGRESRLRHPLTPAGA